MFRDEIHQMLDSLKDMPRKIQWVLDTQPKTIQAAGENPRYANVRLGAVVEHINQGLTFRRRSCDHLGHIRF